MPQQGRQHTAGSDVSIGTGGLTEGGGVPQFIRVLTRGLGAAFFPGSGQPSGTPVMQQAAPPPVIVTPDYTLPILAIGGLGVVLLATQGKKK